MLDTTSVLLLEPPFYLEPSEIGAGGRVILAVAFVPGASESQIFVPGASGVEVYG